jgi:hypothetical protein
VVSLSQAVPNGDFEKWKSFSVPFNYSSADQPEFILITISLTPSKGSHYQSVYCIDDQALLGIK